MIRVTTWILPGNTVGYRNELVRNLKVILNINFTLALWSRLGTYPDIFKSATFSFRMQKFPRPHVSRYFLNRHYFFARTVLNIQDKELGLILWRQWIKKYPHLASPRFRIHGGFKNFNSGGRIQKFQLWRADSKSCGFVYWIHRIRVDGSLIQKEKVADSTISGHLRTGPMTFWSLSFYREL